jgi:putative N6-adenine-specific DNA methylase
VSETTFPIVVKTLTGLEELLAEELRQQGVQEPKVLRRGVSFQGGLEQLYRANMFCRTAISVLREIGSFSFSSQDDFYQKMRELDWGTHFGVEKTIVIYSVAARSELFTNTLFLSQLSKDAIVDAFREKTGERPSVNRDEADIRLNIYVNDNRCIVSLDSSGEPLFKRGYRREGGGAPLNEVLAAGLIMLSGWDKQSNFVDPMCGSATFSIEAGLMANDIAPGSMRKAFSFQNWNDYDAGLWEAIRAEAKNNQVGSRITIMASDMNAKVLDIARKNIMEAGLMGQIKLQRQEFFQFHPPAGGGWVMLNPPYGQRLKQENLPEFYRAIGDTLKNNYPGYKAGIITSDISAMKSIGLKPVLRTTVFNGALECKYMVYELFRGSHKDHVISTRPKRKRI